MDRDDIRIECLRLWHRHDRSPAQVIELAKEYEAYVVGEKTKVEETPKKSQPQKKSGNPDLFK